MTVLARLSNRTKLLALFLVYILIMPAAFHSNPLTNLSTYLVCAAILFWLVVFFFYKIRKLILTDRFYLFFFPIVVAFIIIAVLPLFSQEGWPLNHDGTLWKHRIEAYVMHISQLDIFPIWSSRDGYNMGTPDPLFYHKTFYYVSSFFYILFTNMKHSILLSVGTFMFIGTWGVFRAAKLLGSKNWPALIMGLCFIFLNYTLTNWLLRGAMAEYAAMVFIPLLFVQELKLIRYKRYSHWLGAALLLLYLSHSIVGFYALFTVFIALALTLINANTKEIIQIFKKISLSAVCIIGITLIYLIPMIALSENFDPSTIKSGESTPKYKMVEFTRYFYDTKYEWFSDPYWDLSVQMDLPVLSMIIVALTIVLLSFKKLNHSSFKHKSIALLAMLNSFFIYLQTKSSLWFYDLVPGASFIQFPWRLLSFIQVLNLLILGWLLGHIEQLKLKKIVLAIPLILLAISMVRYPAFYGSMEKWFSNKEMETPTRGFCSNGEFLPQMYGQEFRSLNQAVFMFQQRGIEFEQPYNGLEMIDGNAIALEKLEVEFDATIVNPSQVILPFSYSSLTRLFIEDSIEGRTQIPIYRNEADPRVRAFLPFGNYKLVLKQPTIYSFFIPKMRPHHFPEYENEIECDAELLTENLSQLRSKCNQYIFALFDNITNEYAHSGEYSIKLYETHPYGFTHDLVIEKDYYSDWEVSVWRKGGGTGSIIVSFENAESFSSNEVVAQDSLGWELIKLNFRMPKQVKRTEHIKIFVFSADAEQTLYFDDLTIKKL